MNRVNKQVIKSVLITGAAKRIGAAIAKQFHDEGYHVIVHCNRSIEAGTALVNQFNQIRLGSAFLIVKPLLDPLAPEALINEALEWAGHLNVLVNNASSFLNTECSLFKEEDWNYLFKLNVQVPFRLSVAVAPLLAANQGVIINITDIHAERPLRHYAAYCQTKAALVMQTKCLARELAPHVRVNGVAPGAIVWPEGENQLSEEIKQKIIQSTPLKTHGDAAFIAKAVYALVENPFVTGQILNVDGGRSIA